jgi:hypothetical protein
VRVFGWLLIIGGLLWTLPGLLTTAAFFLAALRAQDEAGLRTASTVTAISLIVNGLIFVFPGLVVAGIGGLLTRRQGRRREDDDDD